ncbi:MAG: ATP-binding cassette domain-containing protein [Vallitaleaceae bacterium]|jgi:energy-coupling factor transporter ATP-binding protein EcfA2|nr:ATP-binding cassette domain-containing protein [Vallitaleaceae bacterium]
MALFRIQELDFRYPNTEKYALKDINTQISTGDFIVICGASGSGKTTLLKHLKKDLMPVGDRAGVVFYKDKPIIDMPPIESVTQIGMVFQDPESQIVMDTVINELTFSMENIGLPRKTMKSRLAEVATYFGVEHLLHRKVSHLSGGQKQIVNLCGVLVLQPQVLIFDEPTAQLDPIARKEFMQMVYQLNFEMNMTIIMSEHLLDDVITYASRVMYMEEGHLVHDLSSRDFCEMMIKKGYEKVYPYLPEISKISTVFDQSSYMVPLTVKEGRALVTSFYKKIVKESDFDLVPDKVNSKTEKNDINDNSETENDANSDVILEIKHAYYTYDIKEDFVLKDVSFAIKENEFITIMGANGSGKSTLLKCLTGQFTLLRGGLFYHKGNTKKQVAFNQLKRDIGYVDQNTMVHFAYQSVRDELDYAFDERLDSKLWRDELLGLFELGELMMKHPYDLSGGEQEKLAILLALAKRPKILLLDEPTKGLDPISKMKLAKILKQIALAHSAVICVTHDTEFAAMYSERTVLIFDNTIVYDGEVRAFFTENHYFTTKINQVMKLIDPTCMLIKDVVEWKNQLEHM